VAILLAAGWVGLAIESLAVNLGAARHVSGAAGEPIVELGCMAHDFGVVTAGPTLEATFVLRNVGDARLIVRKLDGSCECLSGSEQIVVQPGESRALTVRLDTAKAIGPMRMELHYFTSDPVRPAFTLVVSAEVKPSPERD
jgi:hypothetical protein